MMRLWLLLMYCIHTSKDVDGATTTVEDHHYYRPSGTDVSGYPPPNFAANHRSPCPALNSLANHGYLPRDGKSLTPELIQNAVMEVFNIDKALVKEFTSLLPQHLTLAHLSIHGLIEHDASLVHDDSYLKNNPAQINATLVTQFFDHCKDHQFDKRSLAAVRRQREAQCKKENPEYAFSIKEQVSAYGESALVLLAMGNYESKIISAKHATSFLVDEKIPDDFQRSNKPISMTTTLYLAAQIKLIASLGG
ncbi:unnamed protein product [Peronospora belbahrii]|uniref:Heme haloperoxidase family profile domain-containing protein n=1 Tax=Peronospora belbahrii TaxID=622444 RepID=A0ABN8CPC6_9STRA|nr:unnamed protein product [Peronospora belbahrii]